MRRSTLSTERSSEQTGNKTESYGDSADPFLLDFGSSCVVNDELRRKIREETNEIEASTEELTQTIKSEERAQAQLTQDFKHAHEELKNIGRGTTDQLEKAIVHSRILSGLGETIKLELVEPTACETSEVNGRSGSHEEKNNNASNQSSDKSAARKYNLVNKGTKESIKTLASLFKEASSRASTFLADKARKIESTARIQDRIESEKLVEIDSSAGKDVEMHKKDEEDEIARKMGLKKSIQQGLAEKEKQSERLVQNTKLLRLLQQENALEEERLKEKLQEIDDETAASQAALTTSKAALASREVQLSQLRQQNSEIDRCRKLREEKAVEIKMEQGEIEKLSRMHEDLSSKHEEAKAESIAANEALVKAETVAAAAAEEKASNDRLHESEVLPGELELEGLASEKSRMPSLIAELEERKHSLERECDEEVSNLQKLRASLANERVGVVEERKSRQSGQVVFASLRTESKENWEREIGELNEVAKRNKESIQEQETRLVELRKEYEEGRRKIVEAKVARALAERTRELNVLRRFDVSIIDEMRQMEKQLSMDRKVQ